jgi:hypothetical protein
MLYRRCLPCHNTVRFPNSPTSASDKILRRLSPVTEPNRESSGRPNAAPLSQILQEPSPQSHAVPLSRILASQSPLRHAPVDGGLHASAAPHSQILVSPGPLLDRPPAAPSPLLHRPPTSLSSLLQRFQESPSPLLQRSQESPSPVLQHRSTTPVRQNARRSRTPPRPAQIPKRGPKRKAAADLKVNPDQLYVKSQKRHRYTNRRKAQVLSFWLEETPRVIRPGPRGAPFHPAVLLTAPLVLLWPPGRSFPSGDALDSSTCPSLVLQRLPCPYQPLSCPLGRSLNIRRLSSSPMRLFSDSGLGFSIAWRSRHS